MTSRKTDVSRTRCALELAAKADAILSSETASAAEKAHFIQLYSYTRATASWPDDRYTDLMALIVLDDFPVETLNEILRINIEEGEEPILWLADTYDTLPDHDPAHPAAQGTKSVKDGWVSPFIGSSVEEVAAFIQATPKPPKPLAKQFFAVLQKEQYEQSKQLLIYHIPEKASDNADKIELQSIPCPVHLASVFFYGFDRYDWNRAVKQQALYYGEGATWSDDDESNQLMALIVLDDVPTETIDQILEDNADRAEQYSLWLADAYSNLPDYRPNYCVDGTENPISEDWRSQFIGMSIEDAANFIRNAPKPPKPLCKRFFAILQKDSFDQNITMHICKIVPADEDSDVDSEMTEEELKAYAEHKERRRAAIRSAGKSIICKSSTDDSEFEVQIKEFPTDYAGLFHGGGNRHEWEQSL